MIKAIIFDMDGLLIDSEPIWRAVEIEAFATVGIQLTDEMFLETVGWRLDQVTEYWFKKSPWQNKSKTQLQLEIYDAMESSIRLQGQPLPGALEAIKYVQTKGLKAAVASSSPSRLIEAMVSRFSLRDSFDVLHSAENEPEGKPHPAVFLTTAQKMNVSPDECIAVEDSPPGISSAKGAGMLCLAVPDKHADLNQFMEADIVIDSLISFPRALERLLD
jgi:sugar-phosphatase